MTHQLVTEARKCVGAPYVWGCKGDFLFDTERLILEPSMWMPVECYDCSGLVTTSLRRLGGPDWRGSHSAGRLRMACTPVLRGSELEGDLLFRPGHVAIFVAPGKDAAHVVALEAAGGRSSTRSPAAAAKTGAYVVEHEVSASNFTSAGRLPPEVFPFPHVVNGA